MCLLALLFVSLLWSGAYAITVVSQRDAMRQINGALTQQTQLTILCSGDSFDWNVDYAFQVTSDNGAVQSLHFNCNRPFRRSQISYYGIIPDEATELVSRVCAARTPGSILDAAAVDENADTAELNGQTVRLNTGFALLERAAGNANNLDSALTVRTPNSTAVYRADLTIAALCVGVMATQGFAAYNAYADCVTGPTHDQFNDLTRRLNESQLAFENWRASFRLVTAAIDNSTRALQSFRNKTVDWMETTNQRVANANQTLELLRLSIQENNRALAKDVNEVSTAIGGTAQRISVVSSELAGLINSTSSRFQILFSEIVATYANVMQNAQRFVDNLRDDKAVEFGQIRDIHQAIVDQGTNLQKFVIGEGPLRSHNRILQEKIFSTRSKPSPRGRMLYPFTTMPGTAPARDPLNLDPSSSSILYGNDLFRYISRIGGVTYGIVTLEQFVCDTATALTRGPLAPTWRQLYDSIGPPGCDPTWQDSSRVCKCAMLVTEERCRLPDTMNGAQIIQWVDAFTSNSSFANAGCLSPVSAFNRLPITDVLTLAQFGANMTLRGLYGTSQYQYRSTKIKYTTLIDYDASLSDPARYLESLYRPAGSVVRNIPYVHFNTLVVSYQAAYNHLDDYANNVFGVLPGHYTETQSLFDRVNGSDFTRCTTFYIAALSRYYLTVGILRSAGLTTNIDVTVGSSAPTLISDPVYIAGKPGVLPQEGSGIVYDPTNFEGVAYDVPAGDFSISAFTNKGKVTHAISPSEEAQNVEAWEYLNGQTFDHSMAGNSAADYIVSVDTDPQSPTYRRCLTKAESAGGKQCLLRENYEVFATGSIGSPSGGGFLFLGDRGGSYQFTAALPAGAISFESGSACPGVQDVADSQLNTVLQIYNPLAAENRIKVVETGPCGSFVNADVRLPAGQVVFYTARFCALVTKENATQVAFFYRPDPLVESFLPCARTVDVTLSAATVATYRGPVSLNYTLGITTTSSFAEIDAVSATRSMMLNYTANLMRQDLLAYSESFDFRVTRNTSQSSRELIDRLRRLAADATAASLAAADRARRLANLQSSFSGSLQQARNLAAVLTARAAQQYSDLAAAQEASRLSLADLKQANKLEQRDMEAYVETTAALARSVVVNLNAMLDSGAPNWQRAEDSGSDGGGGGSCGFFERCGWVSVGNFVVGAGNTVADTLVSAAENVADLAKSGIEDLFKLLGGPLKTILGFVMLVGLIVGLMCCLIQCLPVIVTACKLGVSCLKVPDTTQMVDGPSPSAKHLLARAKTLAKNPALSV
jgi:hypothetical protein